MKLKRNNPIKYIVICTLIFCLSACSKLPVKPQKDLEDTPIVTKEEIEDELLKISILDILSAEAEKLFSQGQYQDALFIYNQALSEAGDTKNPQLISAIEQVLSKTPAKDIKEFGYIKNIHIPRSLLMYWLGLNYALENNPVKSKPVLETFLAQYPEHHYVSNVVDLLDGINKLLFKNDTLGCLLPLTGKYAIFGERALAGIQLAIAELSKRYSREFNLIIKDTQANPDIAIRAVRQLNEQNVAGIIGPLLTVNAAGHEAEQLGIPMIALTQKSEFPLQGEYLFSNFITPEMQVQTLGAYLFQDLGINKVAILYPDEKYGKKYMELFWDIADEYGADVVGVEPYDGKKTDFTEPIQKLTGQFFPIPDFLKPEVVEPQENDDINHAQDTDLQETDTAQVDEKEEEKIQIDFQALFIPDSPSKVNLILPQLAFNDAKDMYLVGTNLWHHNRILKGSRGYHKRAIITDGFFDNSQNATTAEFTGKFQLLFNKKPNFLEAVSYDTAVILFLTAMDETIASRQLLKNALQSGRAFDGVTGTTFFDADGVAHKELFLMTIKKGKFVEISR